MARFGVALALLICVAAVSARELQQWRPSMAAAEGSSSSSGSSGTWQPGGDSGALENYQQCGGKGGACQDGGNTCVDGPFPGKRCSREAVCTRNTAYHWMCRPSMENSSTSKSKSTSTSGRTGSSFSGSSGYTIPGTDAKVDDLDVSSDGVVRRWKQCGGNTGKCKSLGDGSCRDCAFEGTSCEDGYVCSRILEGFWQCAPKDRFDAGPKCKKLESKSSADEDDDEEDDEEMLMEMLEAPAPAPEEPAQAPEAALPGDDLVVEEETVTEVVTEEPTPAAPATEESKCKAPTPAHEVDGTYLETVYLRNRRRKKYYQECCASCSTFPGCIAFQINVYATNASTCDLFSEFRELVPGSLSSVAGIMTDLAVAATTAGK